jgi:murein L,D-transpeptidase YafK
LTLLDHGKVLKKYRVALGGDPAGPKAQQGDHKTPEGMYQLDGETRTASSIVQFTFPIQMLRTAPGRTRPVWRRAAT